MTAPAIRRRPRVRIDLRGTRAARNEILIGGTREEMHGFFATDPAMTSLAEDRTVDMESLSMQMRRCWIAFVRNGDPNHDGIPCWPAHQFEDGSTFPRRLRHT